jgi:hypothetical protein
MVTISAKTDAFGLLISSLTRIVAVAFIAVGLLMLLGKL